MLITIITVVAIAGFVIWVQSRIGTPVASVTGSKECGGGRVSSGLLPERVKGDYRAVTIDPSKSDSPCQMALDRINNPILMSDAPMLPLPDCDAARCQCAYVRYEDRRQLDRRANHQMHEAICKVIGRENSRLLRNRRRID